MSVAMLCPPARDDHAVEDAGPRGKAAGGATGMGVHQHRQPGFHAAHAHRDFVQPATVVCVEGGRLLRTPEQGTEHRDAAFGIPQRIGEEVDDGTRNAGALQPLRKAAAGAAAAGNAGHGEAAEQHQIGLQAEDALEGDCIHRPAADDGDLVHRRVLRVQLRVFRRIGLAQVGCPADDQAQRVGMQQAQHRKVAALGHHDAPRGARQPDFATLQVGDCHRGLGMREGGRRKRGEQQGSASQHRCVSRAAFR
jgi:hypothetical protein